MTLFGKLGGGTCPACDASTKGGAGGIGTGGKGGGGSGGAGGSPAGGIIREGLVWVGISVCVLQPGCINLGSSGAGTAVLIFSGSIGSGMGSQKGTASALAISGVVDLGDICRSTC